MYSEPDVASSDATNVSCSMVRENDTYVINGKKWWSSGEIKMTLTHCAVIWLWSAIGAGDPNCKITIVMGKTGSDDLPKWPDHTQAEYFLISLFSDIGVIRWFSFPWIRPALKRSDRWKYSVTTVSASFNKLINKKILYIDSPHGHFEIHFENVRVPASNMILGRHRLSYEN